MDSLQHTARTWRPYARGGVPDADVAWVHRPIGLDFGSKMPVGIAISTVAGLIADRNDPPGGAFR